MVLAGFMISTLIYHYFVHNILDFGQGLYQIYTSITRFDSTRYESSGQIMILIKYFKDLIITFIPSTLLYAAYYYLRRNNSRLKGIIDLIFIIFLFAGVYILSVYYTNIILLPLWIMGFDILIEKRIRVLKPVNKKNIVLLGLLLAVPLLAVMGSNQLLARKMFFFMPFWLLAMYILFLEFNTSEDHLKLAKYKYIMLVTVSIVFVFQGFLKHPHYNYSIKRSKYPIENAVRLNHIKVSKYQKDFYERGIFALKDQGFKPGNRVLAFYETYLLVYAAGGYAADGLTYWAYNFTSDRENIPDTKINYIIIDESEINLMTDFLSETDWDFPASYSRTILGTDGHNLSQLGYNYILFSSKL